MCVAFSNSFSLSLSLSLSLSRSLVLFLLPPSLLFSFYLSFSPPPLFCLFCFCRSRFNFATPLYPDKWEHNPFTRTTTTKPIRPSLHFRLSSHLGYHSTQHSSLENEHMLQHSASGNTEQSSLEWTYSTHKYWVMIDHLRMNNEHTLITQHTMSSDECSVWRDPSARRNTFTYPIARFAEERASERRLVVVLTWKREIVR